MHVLLSEGAEHSQLLSLRHAPSKSLQGSFAPQQQDLLQAKPGVSQVSLALHPNPKTLNPKPYNL